MVIGGFLLVLVLRVVCLWIETRDVAPEEEEHVQRGSDANGIYLASNG